MDKTTSKPQRVIHKPNVISATSTSLYTICVLHSAPTGPGSAMSKYNMASYYTMARATLSGVIGPVFTEIHKSSSLLPELFFFFVSNLAVAIVSPQQQQQQLLVWRQQQQWQHTSKVVRKTSRGRVRRTTRQMVL